MPHVWENLVLGGVDAPRILILNPKNECNNPFFHAENTSDWTGPYSIQTEEIDDSYSRYSGKIIYQAMASTYSYIGRNYTTTKKGKAFLFCARIKSKYEYQIACVTDENTVDKEIQSVAVIQPSANFQKIAFVVNIPQNIIGSGLEIGWRIYGSTGSQAELYIDHIFWTEILYDYEMPQPHNSYLKFIQDVTGMNELWHGLMQKVNKKYRPYYHAEYTVIDESYERKRQAISEADLVFCIPHKDSSFGFIGQWDGDFERRYAFDKFISHTGIIPIIGNEFLMNAPIYNTDSGVLYIEDDLVIYS